jgi:hypothetical protein
MLYSWRELERHIYHLAEQNEKTTLILRCQGFSNDCFDFHIFIKEKDENEHEIGHVVITPSKLVYTPSHGGVKITFLD